MTLVDDVSTVEPMPEPSVVERSGWKDRFRIRLGRPAGQGSDGKKTPLDPKMQILRSVFVLVAILSLALLAELLFLSGLQQRAAQQKLFDGFRAQLAEGTAPVDAVDAEGRLVPIGSAVAFLEIPSIGLRQVVVQGTSSAALLDGPGHRIDTPFPGQAGTSVVMGRRASFGGPFRRLPDLIEGDTIRITTGQGESEFEVIGIRREGDPVPAPPGTDEGRLLLMTADGSPYVPDGVLRVDASLVTDLLPGRSVAVAPSGLPPSDQAMASDSSTAWALVFGLQALLAASVAFVWAWHRWSRRKAWIVMTPVLLLIGLLVTQQAAKLLPNMF